VPPHLHGIPLDAEALGDVVRADRIAFHDPIIKCNARVDKCNGRSYSRDMTTTWILTDNDGKNISGPIPFATHGEAVDAHDFKVATGTDSEDVWVTEVEV